MATPGCISSCRTRELISHTIEATLRGHPIFDGLVLISSCDKITPGMLIAAARLKMPTIHIAGGPAIPAISFAESKRLRSEFLKGNLDERQLAEGNAELYSTAGNCAYIGTANTMNSLAEALGMALPGQCRGTGQLSPPGALCRRQRQADRQTGGDGAYQRS